MSLEFRMLGPLAVARDGEELDLGAPKQRALLALLLVDVNRAVSLDRLIEELWNGQPPARATASLQAYVSNLRRLLEPDRAARSSATVLVTRAPGYELRAPDDALDARRFERAARDAHDALERGDARAAVDGATDALGEWRGDALGDFAGEPFATAEAERLTELRLGVVETLAAARLELGDAAGAVPDLEVLTREQPLRERGWELLMRALYASGRQADALRAYASARATLAEDLGIDPGPTLQELERAVLEQRMPVGRRSVPVAATPPASSHAVPAVDDALIGRADARALARRALDDAWRGEPRWLLLSGEAGVGKTRLAQTIADEAAARGFAVGWGRGDEDDAAPAYWPWVQVVRELTAEFDELGRRKWLAEGEVDFLELVEAGGSTDDTLQAEHARFRFLDAACELAARAARARPHLFVLDDLHWADPASLRLLEFMAAHLRHVPLLLVATFRPEESGALGATLASLVRQRGVVRIELGGLDAADVQSLAEQVSGRALSARAVDELHERTGGNPFFVTEVARLWASEGDVGPSADAVPVGVADVVRRRVARLPEDAVAVLTVAAVCGASFDLDLLEVACDLDGDRVLDLVDAAVMTRLVVADDERLGRYRFAHALVRDAITAQVPPLRRRRLHARLARIVEDLPGRSAAEVAHHWCEAAELGDHARAIASAEAAARDADARYAFEEGARWWERALHASDLAQSDLTVRAHLLLGLGLDHHRVGNGQAARRYYAASFDAAETAGDLDAMVRALVSYGAIGGAWLWVDFRAVPDDDVARIERALAKLPDEDDEMRCRLLATLGIAWYPASDPEPSDRYTAQALEMARRIGDPALTAWTLVQRMNALARIDRLDDQRAIATELIAMGDVVPSELRAAAHLAQASLYLSHGDVESSDAHREAVVRIAERGHIASARQQAMYMTVQRALMAGDDERAHALVEQMRDEPVNSGGGGGTTSDLLFTQVYLSAYVRDGLHELRDFLEPFVGVLPLGVLDWLGPALLDGGDVDGVRALAAAAGALDPVPFDWMWIADVCLRAECIAAIGDVDASRSLYEALLPYADLVCSAGTGLMVFGPVSAFLGQLAACFGDRAAAERHYRAALELAQRCAAPRWEAAAKQRLEALR
jgi:DNA-binding SARP family transcriptional activator